MKNFSVLECPVYFDKTNMLDMLSLSAGRAILCQNRLGEQIIADNSWGLDPMKGMIRFGEREFRAGILGSESEIQNTWLWSWAHTESGLPESSTAVSRRVKKLLPLSGDMLHHQRLRIMLTALLAAARLRDMEAPDEPSPLTLLAQGKKRPQIPAVLPVFQFQLHGEVADAPGDLLLPDFL